MFTFEDSDLMGIYAEAKKGLNVAISHNWCIFVAIAHINESSLIGMFFYQCALSQY